MTTRRELIAELSELRADFDRRIGAILQSLQKPAQQTTPPAPSNNGPRPRVADDGDSPDDSDAGRGPDGQFVGRPMTSKRESTCVVCGQRINIGETIVYNAEARRAAHHGCGRAVVREQRGGHRA
jgi:hypothetical protein